MTSYKVEKAVKTQLLLLKRSKIGLAYAMKICVFFAKTPIFDPFCILYSFICLDSRWKVYNKHLTNQICVTLANMVICDIKIHTKTRKKHIFKIKTLRYFSYPSLTRGLCTYQNAYKFCLDI